MAKDPVCPILYNDITRSTITWTDEEFGAYMRLLLEQWDKGCIPSDLKRLSRISESVEKNWDLLKDKFKEIAPGKLSNENMEEIREKREKFKNHQKDNGNKGGRPKKNPNKTQTITQTEPKKKPLEIEIEIEEEIELDIKGGTGGNLILDANQVEDELKNSQTWIDLTAKTYKIPVEFIKQKMDDFIAREKLKEESFKRPLNEIKNHFVNYLIKNKSNDSTTTNKQTRFDRFNKKAGNRGGSTFGATGVN